MKFKDLDINEFIEICDSDLTNKQIAEHYGVDESTIYRWKKKLKKNLNLDKLKNKHDLLSEDKRTIIQLREENKALRKIINDVKKEIHINDSVTKLLYNVNDYEYKQKPIPSYDDFNRKSTGVPVLMLSDIHYGEVVNPTELNGINEYNSKIAEKRINYCVDSALNIVLNDWVYESEWFVMPLIGDIISGTIHDELTESNDQRILQLIISISDILIYQIEKVAKNFKKVFVPCVVGNHGRLHKKFRAKGMVEENYEFIVYKLIERHFNNNENVIIHVSNSPDMRFDIFKKRFLLSHGNTLGGGGQGIAGILPLLYRGNYKKQEKATSLNNSYDVLLIGHYHQSLFLNKIIVNGTTKGPDEYSVNVLNIPYEAPSQNLFIVDKKYNEITYKMAVFCEPSKKINEDLRVTIREYV